MNELRRARISYEAHSLSLLDCAPRGESRCRRIEMPEEEHVIPKAAPLAHRVTRRDGRSEKMPHEDDVRVADLVLERDEGHRRAARIGEIHAAVTDRVE